MAGDWCSRCDGQVHVTHTVVYWTTSSKVVERVCANHAALLGDGPNVVVHELKWHVGRQSDAS